MYALPARPAEVDGPNAVHLLRQGIAPGRPSYCCVCDRPSQTWWSAEPPQRYTPLHDREGCLRELIALWERGEGGEDVEEVPAVRAGAYARRPSSVVSTRARRDHRAAVLSEGFRPGPFWRPGDDAENPWTVVADSACGHYVTPPFERSHAERVLRNMRLLGGTGTPLVPMVGAVLVAPDGAVVESWGESVSLDRARWASVSRLREWRYCSGCDELRWPGSWMTIHGKGRCLVCLASEESSDPRPALPEPDRPRIVHDPQAKQREKLEADRRKRVRKR